MEFKVGDYIFEKVKHKNSLRCFIVGVGYDYYETHFITNGFKDIKRVSKSCPFARKAESVSSKLLAILYGAEDV